MTLAMQSINADKRPPMISNVNKRRRETNAKRKMSTCQKGRESRTLCNEGARVQSQGDTPTPLDSTHTCSVRVPPRDISGYTDHGSDSTICRARNTVRQLSAPPRHNHTHMHASFVRFSSEVRRLVCFMYKPGP